MVELQLADQVHDDAIMSALHNTLVWGLGDLASRSMDGQNQTFLVHVHHEHHTFLSCIRLHFALQGSMVPGFHISHRPSDMF